MPKEITHWWVAQAVYEDLDDDSKIKHAITAHFDGYLLGAVFHDALYYYTGSTPDFLAIPDALHSAEGQDTYAILRSLMSPENYRNGRVSDFGIALAMGLLTHIQTDKNFHPMVYYYTGDYYADNAAEKHLATRRHREFESKLDKHIQQYMGKEAEHNLSQLFNNAKARFISDFTPVLRVAELAINIAIDDIINGYQNYVLARKLYNARLIAKTLQWLSPILPAAAKEVVSLSYFKNEFRFPVAFQQTLVYRHPVTGKEITTDIRRLLAQSAADSLAASANLLTILQSSEVGPSLETGMVNCPVKAMTTFYQY